MIHGRDIAGRFISEANAGFAETGWVWTAVSSSNIGDVGYNAQENTLGVRFLNGSEYHYFGVDEDVYESFLSASSKGKFLYYTVRGAYPYERIT